MGYVKLVLTSQPLTISPGQTDHYWTYVHCCVRVLGAAVVVRVTSSGPRGATAPVYSFGCGLWFVWFFFLHITSPVESRCLQQGWSVAYGLRRSNSESTGLQTFQAAFRRVRQIVLLAAWLVHPVSGTWRVSGLEDDTQVLQLADLPFGLMTHGIGWLSTDFPSGPEDVDAVFTSGGTWPCSSQCGSPSYTPPTPPRSLPRGLSQPTSTSTYLPSAGLLRFFVSSLSPCAASASLLRYFATSLLRCVFSSSQSCIAASHFGIVLWQRCVGLAILLRHRYFTLTSPCCWLNVVSPMGRHNGHFQPCCHAAGSMS